MDDEISPQLAMRTLYRRYGDIVAGKRKTTPKQDLAIRRLVIRGFTSPVWVLAHLEEQGILEPGHEIDEKIVQRRIKEYLPQDGSGDWSATDDVQGNASGVFRVAQWLYEATDGRVWLSLSLARLVGRITACTDISADWAWAFAQAFQAAKVRKDRDTRCLDLALMSRMWEPPPGVHAVAHFPERHPIAWTCQQLGEGRQWVDLLFGLTVLEEKMSGLTFDLPPWAEYDEVPDSQAR